MFSRTAVFERTGKETPDSLHKWRRLNYIYQGMSWKLQPSNGGGPPPHRSFPWVNKYELDVNARPPSSTSTLLLGMHCIHSYIHGVTQFQL